VQVHCHESQIFQWHLHPEALSSLALCGSESRIQYVEYDKAVAAEFVEAKWQEVGFIVGTAAHEEEGETGRDMIGELYRSQGDIVGMFSLADEIVGVGCEDVAVDSGSN
jgi:hypothetical protein